MRAFLYCRVAHDDSFALEHQRFLLQLYAKQAGYTIIGAADEYGSGLTLDRPAIQKVTEAVVAGRVDVVLVHSLTRIGREWGMTQSYICRILRSYKDTPHGTDVHNDTLANPHEIKVFGSRQIYFTEKI
ncbi:hypothetical protein CE91St42_26740 [Oscillospiraceae bacterium]|nr:hypothetical protein CE91St42_26740 [Oscillospiraceae bacterium]